MRKRVEHCRLRLGEMGKRTPPSLPTVLIILLVEAAYAVLIAMSSLILYASTEGLKTAIIAVLPLSKSISDLGLATFMYTSACSFSLMLTLRIAFLTSLAVFNVLFIRWILMFWEHAYQGVLTRSLTVILFALLIMPNTVAAFLILTSLLLTIIFFQSAELRKLFVEAKGEEERRRGGEE